MKKIFFIFTFLFFICSVYGANIQIEQKNFLPRVKMKVFCSGLDAAKNYKVYRKKVYGEEIGKPRFIRGLESATRTFWTPPGVGKYVIKLLDIDANKTVKAVTIMDG